MGKIINVKKQPKTWNLKDFYEKRNQVLFYRNMGGLGDLLMHRMIFEDFKKLSPETEILFACPSRYHPVLEDHPFIDKLLDFEKTSLDDYLMWFNTSSACDRYETFKAPYIDKNRSDIWAGHCGVTLTNHDMHIRLTEDELKRGKQLIDEIKNKKGPTITLCPTSTAVSRSLMPEQIERIAKDLTDRDYFVVGMHSKPVETLTKMGIPTLWDITLREWMAVIAAADYMVTVDTSTLHMAGGIKKPVTGIFTWSDGYQVGKHYPTLNVAQLHRDTNKSWTCGPCYTYFNCPLSREPVKPCLTKLTHEMIMEQIDNMISKFPIN